MAKLSERRAAFVDALFKAFGAGNDITVKLIAPRLAGLALNEATNAGLLQAIQGCVGHKVHHHRIGQLLSSCEGKRFGALELKQDGTCAPKKYHIINWADPPKPPPMPRAPRFNSLTKALEWEAEREEAVEEERREAEREAIRKDPEAHLAYHAATGKWIGSGTNLHPPKPVTTSRVVDGQLVTEPVLGRDGKQLTDKSDAPAANPAPTPAKPIRRGEDKRPPWMQRGESQAKDRAEWDAWQQRLRGGDRVGGAPTAAGGFSDPAGVVSHNMNREWAPKNLGTLWDRTFSGL